MCCSYTLLCLPATFSFHAGTQVQRALRAAIRCHTAWPQQRFERTLEPLCCRRVGRDRALHLRLQESWGTVLVKNGDGKARSHITIQARWNVPPDVPFSIFTCESVTAPQPSQLSYLRPCPPSSEQSRS